MSFLRRMPRSYANVVLSLALFIALGGGAYAATGGLVTSAGTVKLCANSHGALTVVKSSKACRKGTTTLLINQKGIAGAGGASGPQGPAGPAGPVGPSTGAAGGDLTGNYPNPSIGNGKVTTSKLAEAAVTSSKLANNAVTSAKIQDGQVRAADLGAIITASQETSVGAGATNTVTATCPTGTVVISGGAQPNNFGVEMTSLVRAGNGWEYQAKNNSGSSTFMKVFAYCLEA